MTMMKYESFYIVMDNIQKMDRSLSELDQMGIDFFEGKYKLATYHETVYETLFREIYDADGVECIFWYLYESTTNPIHDNIHDIQSLWEHLQQNHLIK